MSETEIDLRPFCAKSFDFRDDLAKPFSRFGFTWATNGCIMVRVPRRDDVPEKEGAVKVATAFHTASLPELVPFVPVSPVQFVAAPTKFCLHCTGRGKIHDCPACTCDCEGCGGSGRAPEMSCVSVGKGFIDRRYADLMLSLPGLEVKLPRRGDDSMGFRFEGGEGVLMLFRKGKHPVDGDLMAGAKAMEAQEPQ